MQEQTITRLIPKIKISEIPKKTKIKITYGQWSISIDTSKEMPKILIEYYSNNPWGQVGQEVIDINTDLRNLVEKWVQWLKDPLNYYKQTQPQDQPQPRPRAQAP